jgi:N-acetylmuramoyl-L-alanine amidase
MRYIILTLLVLSVLAGVLPQPLEAAVDPAYRKARDAYAALQAAPRKQKFRSEWDKVLRQFLQVYERAPAGPHAGESLFMAGKTLAGLYRISQVADDAWLAVAMYERVAGEVPTSSLGDDALALAAELLETRLAAPEEAYLRYRQIVEQYPRGDQAAQARTRLKALARYAPPPPSVTMPPATATPPAAATMPTAVVPTVLAPVVAAGTKEARLTGVRFWSNPGYTRVALDLTANVAYSSDFLSADPVEKLPPRLFLDIGPATLDPALRAPTVVADGLLRQIRTGAADGGKVRVVLDLESVGEYKIFPLNDPYRVVIDIRGTQVEELKALEPAIQAAPPRSDEVAQVLEQRPPPPPPPVMPVAPALTGLRRIVVDAGHGGKDPGAIGPSGLREKDVTLAMAKKIAERLRATLGCEVVLTRDRDVFLPLEERTAIANKVGADLFISVHANAAPNRQAYGIETYYLNFSKNDKAAAVAARENGTSLKEVTDLELILFDLMANSKINESSLLAAEIQRALVGRLAGQFDEVRDLGVRQGPFYVLLGATMPSVLVETAFISHPREERRLASASYHQHAAEAIAEAVQSYARAHKLIAASP